MRWKCLALSVAACALLAVGGAAAGSAGATPVAIYNNIAPKLPGNVASEGFECCSAKEFGGQVQFTAGKWKNPVITVTMSSWACQKGNWSTSEAFAGPETCTSAAKSKFEWPLTVSLYEVNPDNSPGAKIGAASKVFKLPYRPSTSKICNEMAEGNEGAWFDKAEAKCYHGFAAKIAISLRIAKLPEKAIISVSYNTSDYGAEPQRPKNPECDSEAFKNATNNAGCPFDSLNVGAENALSVGSYPLPNYAYISSTSAGEYCGSETTVGTFGISGSSGNPCWKGFQPEFKVMATETT